KAGPTQGHARQMRRRRDGASRLAIAGELGVFLKKSPVPIRLFPLQHGGELAEIAGRNGLAKGFKILGEGKGLGGGRSAEQQQKKQGRKRLSPHFGFSTDWD